MIPCRGNISGTSYFILQKLEFHKEALFFMLNICIVVNQLVHHFLLALDDEVLIKIMV